MPRLIVAIAPEIVAFVLGQLKTRGFVGKVIDIVIGACQIVAPFLVAMCLMTLVAAIAFAWGVRLADHAASAFLYF